MDDRDDVDRRASEAASDAAWALRIFAVDPAGVGGVRLRADAGAARDAWLAELRAALPTGAPWRRLPSHLDEDRLLGGLDLAATLREGRCIGQAGVLAQAHGGVVVLAMAERCEAGIAARIAQVVDAGATPSRGGNRADATPARFGIVALDEAIADDTPMADVLAERLGIDLTLRIERERRDAAMIDGSPAGGAAPAPADALDRARALLPHVAASDAVVTALCEAAQVLGIASLRAPSFALRVARAAAALAGRREVVAADAALAARLVLGPRARAWPQPPAPEDEPASGEAGSRDARPDDAPEAAPAGDPPDAAPGAAPAGDPPDEGPGEDTMKERLLEAAAVALPRALLATIAAGGGVARAGAAAAGRSGGWRRGPLRGRPIGSARGAWRGGARLDVLATLRAAAPWQPLRRADRTGPIASLLIRGDDFHVRRFRERRETTTVFAVDASGSQALHRLAETKGAVELLLAECYVRRDRVAVVAFRGTRAEVLLAPTRSLVHARRSLAALPGGGGTPLASGLAVARALAERVLRDGGTPALVVLTDGSANVALDGTGGRQRAFAEALAAARAWASVGAGALLVDTAPRPHEQARALADAMRARYVALPDADAHALAREIGRGKRRA